MMMGVLIARIAGFLGRWSGVYSVHYKERIEWMER